MVSQIPLKYYEIFIHEILTIVFIEANRYLLRDSGMGSGTFLKIHQRDHIL